MNKEDYPYGRIKQAIEYLTENQSRQPGLFEIADHAAMSPHHFQRVFTEWVGVSPKKFLQYLTANYLKGRIHSGESLILLAEESGLSSQSRVYDHFVKVEAMTPGEYKRQASGLEIRYGWHLTEFGPCLIATTQRGICRLVFYVPGEEEREKREMEAAWPEAQLVEDQEETRRSLEQVFPQERSVVPTLSVLLKGTPFQLKVWEALLSIPPGYLTTYGNLAGMIKQPSASRAVGSAVGKNTLAYLIPCHRVIRQDGIIGQYRWGSSLKKALVGKEMVERERSEIGDARNQI
jgi:AraC family transcriptional regulator of adaptative response/methylated-DNA-[protein]-cysteine methyltransferase